MRTARLLLFLLALAACGPAEQPAGSLPDAAFRGERRATAPGGDTAQPSPTRPTAFDAAAPDTTDRAAMESDGGADRVPGRYRALHPGDSLWQRALRLHYDAIVVDGHVDTPSRMVDDGYDATRRHRSTQAQVDVPRMGQGGLDAAFFSAYVAPAYGEGASAVARARQLIGETKRQLDRTDAAALATSAADVRRLARANRRVVLLGLEGGHALAASADTLRALYEAGVRYVTLTHVNTNSWADASQSLPRHGGLTPHGEALVRAMNDLGMLVDLSHASDSTFYDALRVSRAPVLLSHSSARALTPNVRNASDDMLRALAENGGVVMINFFDAMVNTHLDAGVMAEVDRRLDAGGLSRRQLWRVVYDVKAERGLPGATLEHVLDHIDHTVRVAGVDHVGLGSDFDGVFDLPAGLRDVTRLPWITYGLLQRGYSDGDVRKILGGNVLRVMEAAERAATRDEKGAR